MAGSLMRLTPPAARMSAGMRSSAMTAHAPASSAMRGLLGGGDVHDDAALEHLGQLAVELGTLNSAGGDFFHIFVSFFGGSYFCKGSYG